MKIYKELADGSFRIGEMTVPKITKNRHYVNMLLEVEEGEATIEAYLGSSFEALALQHASEVFDRVDDISLLRADTKVLALLKAGPNQIDQYINNNVTDMDSAKAVLRILARSVAVLASTIVN